ncbi:MAG: fumarylacetoacetate hydrolase family protein [Hyphomicrobiales bacterium]|nr:fumarylacetoacetate hydrolase family protein [Hyphomicrobiales bacterium]
MKLLRHGPVGAEKPGLLDVAGRIRDLTDVVDDVAGAALAPAALARLAAIDPESLPLVPAGARLGPCVGSVGKFVAIGLNYSEHAAEAGMAIPKEPVVFMKATSCISGPNDDVVTPRGSTKLDWEVELGVVIGTEARYVTQEAALDHVAGYCVVNDVSERAFQAERGGTWDKGKGCDSFGPIGPWLVTRDEVPDPQALRLWLSVDGVMRQDGTTKTMIFPVAELVSYVSQFMSLQPGDVITTGTPAGVGLGIKPEPIFLKAGQVMRLGVEGLGEQTQTVVAPV